MKCNKCNTDKIRVRGGKRPSKGFYYVDEKKGYWNGHKCPQCFNSELSTGTAARKAGNRVCRKCFKKLPKSQYFLHVGCASLASYHDFSTEYAYYGG